MEYRKLISFGKSSFVVSLPKTWVRQHKLVKGDLIYFEEQNTDLILKPRSNKTEEESKEIVINVDGKSLFTVRREISSAYILNYRKIILKGSEVKSKIKELQSSIQHFIALEVMEQSPDSIVASDFLNMDKVSIEELIRKMDLVTRTMLKECSQLFKDEAILEAIKERDKDVDRLYFLLFRTVLYGLQNPGKVLKAFNLTSVDLLKIKFIGYYIEAIADETRRIVRSAQGAIVGPSEKKQIEQLVNKVYDYFAQTMKSVYNKDIKLSLQLSEMKKEFEADLEVLEKSTAKVPELYKVIHRFDRVVLSIHGLGRLVYTFT